MVFPRREDRVEGDAVKAQPRNVAEVFADAVDRSAEFAAHGISSQFLFAGRIGDFVFCAGKAVR
jgi:hypothetical protein